jgi:hypothetical protein
LCLRPAEESFDQIIPEIQAGCLVTAVLVSSHWGEQHYASDEVALAIDLARRGRHRVVPVWLDDVPYEKRPYGLMVKKGILLPELGSLTAVADELVHVVGRARRAAAERGWLAEAVSDVKLGPNDVAALRRLQVLDMSASEVKIDGDLARDMQREILRRWLDDEQRPDR